MRAEPGSGLRRSLLPTQQLIPLTTTERSSLLAFPRRPAQGLGGRDSDLDPETQSDRAADRQRYSQSEVQSDRGTVRQRISQSEVQSVRGTVRQRSSQSDRDTVRQRFSQSEGQSDRGTVRQR